MNKEEIELFVSGLQMITEEHIKLMQPNKIEELIIKAAHIITRLNSLNVKACILCGEYFDEHCGKDHKCTGYKYD